MIICHTGDTHIDGRDPHATLEEQCRWLKWIADDAAEHGAQLLLHGGDVYERASTPEEREVAAEVFSHWCERMPLGCVVARGNHDAPKDVEILGKLRTKAPLHVCEETSIIHLRGVSVAVLPWPRRAWLAALMGDVSRLELGEAALAGLRAVLAGFAGGWKNNVPRILLAHAELGAASLDSGQPVAARCDVPLSEVDLLATDADFAALAHIHKSQTLGGGAIRYPGSPRPTAFGQDDDPKGYSLVEVRRGEAPVITHRVSPARRLVTVQGGVIAETGRLTTEEDFDESTWWPGPERDDAIRLQYSVSESRRVAVREQAEELKRLWLAEGAHSVKIDEQVLTVHRVRSEAIREALTTAQRVEAWWSARGGRPARATQILSLLNDLEVAA